MIITIPSFGLSTTGGDRMIITIANGLSKRGHVVNMVNLGTKVLPYKISKEVNVIAVPFHSEKKNLFDFVLRGMNKLANNLPPSDIYLANWVYTVLPCIANDRRGRTIFLAQADEAYDFVPPRLKILNGISYEAFKLNIPIVVPSTFLGKMIKQRFRNRTIVIPPCVNVNTFKPKTKKNPHVLKLLFVGDVESKNKGLDILMRACAHIKDINFELHIATQRSVTFDTKYNVFVHKPRNNRELAHIYNESDVFFHLSQKEGFGLTLLEAMASGLIGVVTDSGGINDFAVNKKNCLIVQRNVDSVVSTIYGIHNNTKRFKNTIISNAIKTAAQYSEKRMIDSFESLFLKYISKN